MRAFFGPTILICLVAATCAANAQSLLTVAGAGWTVTVDQEHQAITVSHETLGPVLANVRLNLRAERGLIPLADWSAQRKTQNLVSFLTGKPPTRWQIELDPDALKMSCSSTAAVLTANAPASASRIPARLLDPEGFPVDWAGTYEVHEGYGGPVTRQRSFLPRRNPDVMYFALGPVSSSNLHSLFDRKNDIAIDFPDQTVMQRTRQDPDVLEVAIPVPGNSMVRLIPDYYTKTLGVPFYVPLDDSYFRKAPALWCSWDSCYQNVREEDIVRNADWIAAHLKPYGFDYIVLDDGYDRGKRGEHYWIENWNKEKFPHGPKWLTDHIKSKGLHPGIWIVPNAYAGAVDQHPNWYLRDKQGNLIRDYNTPALDSTNPEVLEFLRREFQTLDEWGFEYYKFDGEHAMPKYVPAVDKDRLYDKSIDPIVAYQNRLKLIRSTIGPERFIEGCPAGTPLNGIGFFNSYFNGEDLYGSWQGNYAFFSSINANAFLSHIVVYNMAGEGIEMAPLMTVEEAKLKRPPPVVSVARSRENPLVGFGTTLAEAHTLATYASLTGVVYSLSSVMPDLPEERTRLLKMTLPTMPIVPIDLFSRGTDMPLWDLFKRTTPDDYVHRYPEILDLKVAAKSGTYDVVGLTNWRSWPETRELSFASKLGLDTAPRYVVFDFWAQKLAGVFQDRMPVEIEPHDTRVLLVHPWLNRPQLVGTSRHITGAYSIQDMAWDSSKNRLTGTSDTVAGDPYSLWFYVPDGVSFSHAQVRTASGMDVPAQQELSGNTLRITSTGVPELVNWEIEFGARASN